MAFFHAPTTDKLLHCDVTFVLGDDSFPLKGDFVHTEGLH